MPSTTRWTTSTDPSPSDVETRSSGTPGVRFWDSAPDTHGPATEVVRLLRRDGVREPSGDVDPWLTDVDDGGAGGGARLLRLYEDMVVVRRIDAEATALQRQGELALWPPLLGQEAAQVASAHALRPGDFVFGSYREHGVAYVRGVSPVDLVREWRGVVGSGWDPYAVGMATPQVIVGGQPLHAVGYAMGILADAKREQAGGGDRATLDRESGAADRTRADDEGTAVAVAYFGDGAMSQGAVNEAFVFAATWSAPVVFFCQNNQWAISEPVSLQSRVPLVSRAAGFGLPGVRVDGNDALAVLAVTRAARHRAATGGGPTLIEAVTYRRGPHTTADDPTRYRDAAEVEAWAQRDPVDRFATYLRARGVLTGDAEARVRDVADQVAAELRARTAAVEDPEPLTIFDHVYTEPHRALAAQREAYARYLAGFADDGLADARSSTDAGSARDGFARDAEASR